MPNSTVMLRRLLSFVAPPRCIVCGAAIDSPSQLLCLPCLGALPRAMLHRMPSNPVRDILDNAVAPPLLTAAWMNYRHDSPYAHIVRKAKYSSRPSLSRYAARLFATELAADSPEFADIDVLLPVPMHWRKNLGRGFNQAEFVAKGIADVGRSAVADNLIAVRPHATQTHRSRSERLQNLSGTMKLIAPHELEGLNIAIVDDVITTGATLTECVAAISAAARPASISAISLAIR